MKDDKYGLRRTDKMINRHHQIKQTSIIMHYVL